MRKPIKILSIVVLSAFCLQQLAMAVPGVPTHTLAPTLPIIFNIPESVAILEDSYDSSRLGQSQDDIKTIVLIQDAHTNQSGQLNIAKTITHIMNKDPMRFVFTEAASGDHSLHNLQEFASQSKRQKVGLDYLRKGYLHGTAYASLVGEHNFTLWGVEDMQLYIDSVRIYEQVTQERQRALGYLSQLDRTIKSLKSQIYNEDLQSLDRARQAYQSEMMSLTEYFEVLKQFAAGEYVDLSGLPHLRFLDELKELELQIDFKKANQEQALAIKALSQEDQIYLNTLIHNQKYTPSKLIIKTENSAKGFYALLAEKLDKRQNEYPELFKYLHYLERSKNMNAKALLDEYAILEQMAFDALAQTQDELLMVLFAKRIESLRNLLNLRITPKAYAELDSKLGQYDMDVISGFLNRKIAESMKNYEQAIFTNEFYLETIDLAKSFYALTYARDVAFVDDALRQMALYEQDKSIMVAGGFHTPNLKKLLEDRGVSYIVITPQVMHETNHIQYEQLLLGQVDYLNRQFSINTIQNTIGTLQPRDLNLGGQSGYQSLVAELTSPSALKAIATEGTPNSFSRMSNRSVRDRQDRNRKVQLEIQKARRQAKALAKKINKSNKAATKHPDHEKWKGDLAYYLSKVDDLRSEQRRSRMSDLEQAIKQIGEVVDRGSNESLLDEMSPTHAFKTAYQEIVEAIAIGGGVYEASFDERQRYIAEAFPSGKFKKLNKVLTILKNQEKLLIDSKEPADYMRLMRRFESLKHIQGLNINEAKLLRLALEISLGIYEHEGRVLELQNYKEQLELELAQPGQGKFHKIAAIQDIHGSAHRLASLVGYAFGLKDEEGDLVFDRVAKKEGRTNLQALQAALVEANINPNDVDVTIVGLADKWDRGKDPAGVFEIVSWLTSIGKAEPLVGNHDIWRANGVLRLHDYYAKQGVDYRDKLNEGRHLAYWAWDTINHEGWSVVEFEQENERRFNEQVDRVNEEFYEKTIYDDWVPLEHISLANIRAEKEGTILQRAKDANADIRKKNNAMASRAKEQYRADHEEDSEFEELEGEALEQYLIEHASEFPIQPQKPLPDIAGPVNDSLIKRMKGYNQTIRLAAEAANESITLIELDTITKDNYYKNDVIVRRALWDLKHYHLARIDELRNLHLHNLWPQGDDGFDVAYETDAGIELRGVPALQAISEKIIRFFEKYTVDELLHELTTQGEELGFTERVFNELGRELELVNAVYADKGGGATMIDYQKFIATGGIDGKVGQGIETQIDNFDGADGERLFWGDILTGHIDSKKWLKDSIAPNYPSPITGRSMRNVDGGMAFAYHRGGFVAIYDPAQGLRLYGYLSEDGSVADTIDDQTLHFLKQLNPKQQYLLKRNHDTRAHQHERLQAILEALSYEADGLAKELKTINKARSDKYATISEESDENFRLLVAKYKENLVLNAIEGEQWSKARTLVEKNKTSLGTLAPLLEDLIDASVRMAEVDGETIGGVGVGKALVGEIGLSLSALNLGGLLREVEPEGEDLADVELFAAAAYRALNSDDAETFSFLSKDSEALYTVTVDGAGDGAELVLSFGENLAPYTFNKAAALEKLAHLRADEKRRIEELVYAAAAQSEARQMAKEHLDGARAWALDYQIAFDDLFAKLSDAEKVVHLNLFLASAQWSLRRVWGKNNQFYMSQATYDALPISAQRVFNNASVLNDYRIKIGEPDGSRLIVNGYTQDDAGKRDHFNLRLQAIRRGQIPQYLKMIVMPHIVLQDTLIIPTQIENDTLREAFAQAKEISTETYTIIAKGWQSAPSQNILLPGLQYIDGFQFTNQQVLKLFLLPISQWLRAARMGAKQLAVAA
ncbi:MAG: hypothetical protein ACI9Y8_000785 [Candidatus Omnitrophota bacterium]